MLQKQLEKLKRLLDDTKDKLQKQENLNIDLESQMFDIKKDKKKAEKQNIYLQKKIKQLQD